MSIIGGALFVLFVAMLVVLAVSLVLGVFTR